MKFDILMRCAVTALAPLLLSSCASIPDGTGTAGTAHVRFNQQAESDAIVRFSSWDLITITKPDTREGGFLPLYRLPEAEKVLARPDFPHHLAVVICGCFLSAAQETDLQTKWTSVLGRMGYQRVVFLRAGYKEQVNGLQVTKDLPLTQRVVKGG